MKTPWIFTVGIPLFVSACGFGLAEVLLRSVLQDGFHVVLLPFGLIAIALVGAGVFPIAVRNRDPMLAEAASFLLCAVCVGAFGLLFTIQFVRNDSAQSTKGHLMKVLHVDGRRQAGDHLDLQLADARHNFTWYSGRKDCSDGAEILALQTEAPLAVTIEHVGSRVIGLRAHGRDYLNVSRERRRERTNLLAFGLALLVAAAFAGYFAHKRCAEIRARPLALANGAPPQR